MARYIRKLFLNIFIIGLEAMLIWVGYNAFTQQWGPILGAGVLIGILVVLWILISLSRQKGFRRQRPGLVKTTLVVLLLAVICTFAGVQPLVGYKDSLIEGYKLRAEAKRIEAQRELTEIIFSMPPIIAETAPKRDEPSLSHEIKGSTDLSEMAEPSIVSETMDMHQVEQIAFTLINSYREENGVPATVWDDKLYELSIAHTQEMADRQELFHGSGDVIGENCWGGQGYNYYNDYDEFALEIVLGWINSPLHNAWLLHAPIRESCVSIVSNSDGQYASWTFWMNKLSDGPELVMKISREYEKAGSDLDWISWLESRGYLN